MDARTKKGDEDMKYPDSWYIDSGLFGADMETWMQNHHEKLVKTRKVHKCAYCQKDIPKGDYAVNESAIFPYEGGWQSCYICENCVNEWLDKTKGWLDKCPFCGGDATLQSNDFGFPHWVYCMDCGAKVHGGLQESEEQSVIASIDAWNRRV